MKLMWPKRHEIHHFLKPKEGAQAEQTGPGGLLVSASTLTRDETIVQCFLVVMG